MKTIYNHPITSEKGIDYVLLEDYTKLLRMIEEYQSIIEDTKKFVKLLYTGGYISEMSKNNILTRLGGKDE
ncbi:MAG: hypothetical protein MR598_03230 [Erysipelotrichaceae bacterium]|nr:hypothetical protein [Erysipelotrichaceae bacterium]